MEEYAHNIFAEARAFLKEERLKKYGYAAEWIRAVPAKSVDETRGPAYPGGPEPPPEEPAHVRRRTREVLTQAILDQGL